MMDLLHAHRVTVIYLATVATVFVLLYLRECIG